jgi:hypothetical protein
MYNSIQAIIDNKDYEIAFFNKELIEINLEVCLKKFDTKIVSWVSNSPEKLSSNLKILQTYDHIANTLSIHKNLKAKKPKSKSSSREKLIRAASAEDLEYDDCGDDSGREKPVRLESSREKKPEKSGLRGYSKGESLSKEVSFEKEGEPGNYRHYGMYQDTGAPNSQPDNTRPSLQDNYFLKGTNQYPPKSASKARPDAPTDNLEKIDLEKTSKLNNKLKDLVSDFKNAAPLSHTNSKSFQNQPNLYTANPNPQTYNQDDHPQNYSNIYTKPALNVNDQNPRFFPTNEENYNSSIRNITAPYKNTPFNPNEYNMNNTAGPIARYSGGPTGYSHTKTANKKSHSYEH